MHTTRQRQLAKQLGTLAREAVQQFSKAVRISAPITELSSINSNIARLPAAKWRLLRQMRDVDEASDLL